MILGLAPGLPGKRTHIRSGPRGHAPGRQVHARDPRTRQIFASGIVTILRPERYNGRANWYVVRDAEPHEAARVLCSEATWLDPDTPQ
ncbi:hypothetical protein [Nonomuraea sp. NPDC050202]|jgi:hypothetical protein|uniref:hypothetical protein n=1 Tax=Nonomuraea sp. NPDC050202 TaxID=3155035 RepID=UPI0033ED5315